MNKYIHSLILKGGFGQIVLGFALAMVLPAAMASGIVAPRGEAAKPEVLRLEGCVFEWRPYSHIQDGIRKGIVIDLLRELEGALKLNFDVRFLSLPRCVAQLREGRLDFAPYMDSDYATVVKNQVSVVYHVAGMVVKADSPHQRFKRMSQFNGELIGIQRGSSLLNRLRPYRAIRWQQDSHGNEVWQMLVNDNLDGAIGDLAFLSTQDMYRDGQIRFLQPPVAVMPLKMAFNQKHAHLIPKLDAELSRMMKDGRLASIYQRHSELSFQQILDLSTAATIEPED